MQLGNTFGNTVFSIIYTPQFGIIGKIKFGTKIKYLMVISFEKKIKNVQIRLIVLKQKQMSIFPYTSIHCAAPLELY